VALKPAFKGIQVTLRAQKYSVQKTCAGLPLFLRRFPSVSAQVWLCFCAGFLSNLRRFFFEPKRMLKDTLSTL